MPSWQEMLPIPFRAPALSDNGVTTNLALPYCNNVDVNVHHNSITLNSSLGDELFSSTPAGAGGVTFCNGSDYYKFNYNWVCGNMSTGDGAGVAHVGFTYDGDIEHNTIVYNQTHQPHDRDQRRRPAHHGRPRRGSAVRPDNRRGLRSLRRGADSAQRRNRPRPGRQREPDPGQFRRQR